MSEPTEIAAALRQLQLEITNWDYALVENNPAETIPTADLRPMFQSFYDIIRPVYSQLLEAAP